jgi:hypothetical protein
MKRSDYRRTILTSIYTRSKQFYLPRESEEEMATMSGNIDTEVFILAPPPNKHKTKEILSTTNYHIFKLETANRPISEDRAQKIADQIKAGNNQLADYPIIVSPDYVILDGQHRYRAAQIAQVEIFYIISTEMTMEKAAQAVVNVKGWTIRDWIHHWSELKSPHYITLREFARKYPWMSVTELTRLCSTSGYRRTEFNSGHYEADRTRFADKVAQMILDFKPLHKGWNTHTFVNALMQLAADPNYSHQRMMRKMVYQYGRLKRCATVPFYLENLTEIYNNREREEHHVYFRQKSRIHPLEADRG